MKTVEISDEAWDRIMRDSKGASFDAMLWMMIRDFEESKKMNREIMGAMLAIATSSSKEDFKQRLKEMNIGKGEDFSL